MQKEFTELYNLINNYVEPYSGDYIDINYQFDKENSYLFFLLTIFFISFILFIVIYYTNK